MDKPFFRHGGARPAVLLAIAAAHMGLIFAFGSLTSRSEVATDTPALEVSLSMEARPHIEAPPIALRFVEPALPAIEPPLIPLPEEPMRRNAISVTRAESTPSQTYAGKTITIDDVAYLKPPRPHYPAESRRCREQGLVLLRVMIDELGHVVSIDIQRSSGHARLDAAARDAVERALFRPYLENGVARTVLATIPIEFNWKPRGGESGPRRS